MALHEDAVCGFATTGPAWGSGPSTRGELLALCVDPEWWRRGIGRRLVDEARRRLSQRGFTEAVLWVLVANQSADSFPDRWMAPGRHAP
jgi:ribosomal protein S18 acetylase RimI-like enzyme